MNGRIIQNTAQFQVCRDLGYNKTMCSNIDNHTQEENNVQEQVIPPAIPVTILSQVASFNMKLGILTALPSILLALFVGPWSDRFLICKDPSSCHGSFQGTAGSRSC